MSFAPLYAGCAAASTAVTVAPGKIIQATTSFYGYFPALSIGAISGPLRGVQVINAIYVLAPSDTVFTLTINNSVPQNWFDHVRVQLRNGASAVYHTNNVRSYSGGSWSWGPENGVIVTWIDVDIGQPRAVVIE